MNLSTRQMRVFLQVARTGSFTRAAEQSHMTQAGLSILVREMERNLDVRLFDRTTRAVELTPAGRRLVPVLERVLRELDGIGAEIGAMGQATRRFLRIAATPLVSSQLLPQLLGRFRDSHPEIELQLRDASLGDVEKLVREGEADLGLGFFFRSTAGLQRTPMGEFQLMRVSPATRRPRELGSVSWSSLQGARLVGLPADNPIQKTIDQQLRKLHIRCEPAQAVSFFSTLISMVEAGFGSAIMPTFAMSACRRHHVAVDLLSAPQVDLPFFQLTKRGSEATPASRAFTETLSAQLPSMSR